MPEHRLALPFDFQRLPIFSPNRFNFLFAHWAADLKPKKVGSWHRAEFLGPINKSSLLLKNIRFFTENIQCSN
jgi:hypothetical protein